LIAARFVIFSAHFVKCDMSEQCTIESMRALPWCGFAIVAACNYSPTPAGGDLPDTPIPVECGWTFAPHVIGNPCDLTLNAPMTLTPDTWVYDTVNGELKDPGGIASTPPSIVVAGDPQTRVLATMSLVIEQGATLEVRGSHALAIVVDTMATIDGIIDVSATLEGNAITPGPGGNAASCETRKGGIGGSAVGTTNGGGGGGGGGFGSPGGVGGIGGDSNAPGGIGGVASDPAFAMIGGCGGGVGGVSDSVAGVAGAGGGALLLVVKDAAAIRTSAQLRSAGSGALPGRDNSGGPGGGSGGLIAVETATLVISGTLCANGGGGAGGSADTVFGGSGESGTCSATVAANGGGAPSSNDGEGGDGGFGSTAPMPGELNMGDDGAGGGGGGVGRIFLRASSLNNTGTVSPPPVELPF
jgi:hypothetical protein